MRNRISSTRSFGPMLSTESGGPAVLDRPENVAAIDEVLANAPAEYLGDAEFENETAVADAPVAHVEAAVVDCRQSPKPKPPLLMRRSSRPLHRLLSIRQSRPRRLASPSPTLA